MITSLANLLNKKKFNASDEATIAEVMNSFHLPLTSSMIVFNKGIISFKGISSALRMEILLKKEHIILTCNNQGLYVRDIL